jgi:hypothetical protein
MSKGDTFENDLLKLLFNAVAIANIADNAAAAPLASLFVSFHTGDPGEAGSEATNETAYTGYARVAVARTAGGWTVAGNSVSPVANVDAPVCTAVPGADITHWAVGVASVGATKVLYSGTLNAPIVMTVGTIPRLTPASTITED